MLVLCGSFSDEIPQNRTETDQGRPSLVGDGVSACPEDIPLITLPDDAPDKCQRAGRGQHGPVDGGASSSLLREESEFQGLPEGH